MAEMTPQELDEVLRLVDTFNRDKMTGRAQPMGAPASARSAPNPIADALLRYGPMPAQLATEMTGVPSLVRGGSAIGTGAAQGDMAGVVGGMGEAALGMVPAASQNAMLAKALMSSAPRSAATLGVAGAATAVPEAAEAAKLTNAQQRRMEMERQRQEMEMQAEAARRQGEVDQEKARAAAQLQAEEARRQSEAQAKRDEAAMPIRERYPWMGPVSTGTGYALAGGVPALAKVLMNKRTFSPESVASRLDDATETGHSLLDKAKPAAKDRVAKRMTGREIENLLETVEASNSKASKAAKWSGDNIALPAAGGILAAEARIAPDKFDLDNPNLSKENRDKAQASIGDKDQWALSALIGALTGWSSQKVAGMMTKRKEPNVERAQAVLDTLGERRR